MYGLAMMNAVRRSSVDSQKRLARLLPLLFVLRAVSHIQNDYISQSVEVFFY